MKITARIVAAGERWSASFPKVDIDRAFPMVDGRRQTDIAGCMAELRDEAHITHSGSDTSLLRAIVCRWIETVNEWKDQNCVSSDPDEMTESRARMNKRAERNMVTTATAVWRKAGTDQVSVEISTMDNDVVEKRKWERMFAWIMADAVRFVSDELEANGYKPIVLRGGTAELCAQLDLFRLNAGREKCANHRKGYCSPVKPDCPCFRNGRCEDIGR